VKTQTGQDLKPTFLQAHLAMLLQPLQDIRDRTSRDHREFFDQLVADVKIRGVQVPIIAYREGDKLRIIDGLTRYLAALLALLDTVPALVYAEKPSEADLKLGMLLANSMRRDMKVLELAVIYQDLKRLNGWSDAELARNLHVSPSHVAKVLAISAKLCEPCRVMVSSGELAPRAAYAISRIADIATQINLAAQFKEGKLCVEGVEAKVVEILKGCKKPEKEKSLTLKCDGVELKATKPTRESVRAFIDRVTVAFRKLKEKDDIFDLGFHFKST